jgi:hypothetical protein
MLIKTPRRRKKKSQLAYATRAITFSTNVADRATHTVSDGTKPIGHRRAPKPQLHVLPEKLEIKLALFDPARHYRKYKASSPQLKKKISCFVPTTCLASSTSFIARMSLTRFAAVYPKSK